MGTSVDSPAPLRTAVRLRLGGRVQGVGFRPFVYRLAQRLHIDGSVRNRGAHVEVLAEGAPAEVERFVTALLEEAPAIARPVLLDRHAVPAGDCAGFRIDGSDDARGPGAHLPPDYFTCSDCLRELTDPSDRRYGYPFINCTQCGPRYTLIAALPYDRARTSMAQFDLCPACRAEYQNPADRRFHAEPLACPVCGPQLQWVAPGVKLRNTAAALDACLAILRRGGIVAVKGVGGYHLLCAAADDGAVARLRRRKARPHKALAVLFPERGGDGLDAVRKHCRVDAAAGAALRDPARPIVLLPRRPDSALSELLAPGLTELGALLPYSPLHHLLSRSFGEPLVATSGNRSGEPVITDPAEAQRRLEAVADGFLHHDRPILRPADDSVLRPAAGGPRPLRLGRGIAPLELTLETRVPEPVLAVGGHLKNTVALAWDDRVVVSPHIGELDAPRSLAVFERVIADLQSLYGVTARRCVHDAHPGYASSRWARSCGLTTAAVGHHAAHASAVVGEHPGQQLWLAFTWDGVGYGDDGSLWGGEALLGRPGQWRRVASLRPFRLPGGERAARQPWRCAAALCWETGTSWAGLLEETTVLRQAWAQGRNAPWTSATGRLFDAAAALLDVVQEASFEGQGPMYLEALAHRGGHPAPVPLPVRIDDQGVRRWDWAPLVPMLLDDRRPVPERAACLHLSLAAALCREAEYWRGQVGDFAVALGGGVFQNRLLLELASAQLRSAGFTVRTSERLPCNDGGLCFGQLVEWLGTVASERREMR